MIRKAGTGRALNPILKGFNPDPSICRVGRDFYIATSTFEWFPGVQIYHSRDLVNWKLVARPLNRINQLDMAGTPNSTGVWAPCLTHYQGLFYLVYTNTRSSVRQMDVPNYLITTEDLTGKWSDPVYLNRSGFDPSLFHDTDGRKWLVYMRWSTCHNRNTFDGLLLQEYDPVQQKLVGPVKKIFRGTGLKFTEGPHLYKRNDYYYLITAEGGTGYEHAVSLCRSRTLEGPYEVHPQNPILRGDKTRLHTSLQKCGHASIVDTPQGDWYMVHLASRPVKGTSRCILGRETAIQKVRWDDDDWLRLAHGSSFPADEVEISLPTSEEINEHANFFDDFGQDELNIHWHTMRIPASERLLSLKERPGFLRLHGRESLESRFEQSLIARRQQSFVFRAETRMFFHPEHDQHMAGLVYIYNTSNYYYLRMTRDETLKKFALGILACSNGDLSDSLDQDDNVFMDTLEPVELKAEVSHKDLRFYYRIAGRPWVPVGKVYDASRLSDDYIFPHEMAFTGAFIGLCCQDLAVGGHPADFEYFRYDED